MKGFSQLADDAAKALTPIADWDDARDALDILTGGDLDMTQLDLLTDMVVTRWAKQ